MTPICCSSMLWVTTHRACMAVAVCDQYAVRIATGLCIHVEKP